MNGSATILRFFRKILIPANLGSGQKSSTKKKKGRLRVSRSIYESFQNRLVVLGLFRNAILVVGFNSEDFPEERSSLDRPIFEEGIKCRYDDEGEKG